MGCKEMCSASNGSCITILQGDTFESKPKRLKQGVQDVEVYATSNQVFQNIIVLISSIFYFFLNCTNIIFTIEILFKITSHCLQISINKPFSFSVGLVTVFHLSILLEV